MARSYPPLVPPHPTPTADSQLVANLNALIELERGFRSACYAAARHLRSDMFIDTVHDLAERSTSAIGGLASYVDDLGGIAPDEASSRELLYNNADVIRGLRDPHQVLAALQAAADEVEAGYARALDLEPERIPADVLACVRELHSRLTESVATLRAQLH